MQQLFVVTLQTKSLVLWSSCQPLHSGHAHNAIAHFLQKIHKEGTLNFIAEPQYPNPMML